MKRREFLINSTVLTGGSLLLSGNHLWAASPSAENNQELYEVFKNPESGYRPFVRWWWNGDKLEKNELIRELHLLKEAGIGGVEINPIEFPELAKDTNPPKPALKWLSDEWIEMLQVTFDEAEKLDMTCDLIVGSGWPFGSEMLERNERAQVVILFAEEIEGPTIFETSQFNIFDTVDPGVTVPYPGRTFEILSLQLAPNPLNDLSQSIDLSDKKKDKVIILDIPEGKHVLYALVKVDSFASVINGAPGAAGPILNHFDKNAVRKYLDHMSDTIEQKTGPLSNHLRAFFTDSMELEGCNWSEDIPEEFQKRRGYDLMPYLPFILYKVGRLGGVVSYEYGAEKSKELTEILNRVRFDFERTKAELLNERFTKTYLQWCKDQNVLSRAQSYGNGFFPLESSLGYDLPEGESWTTNWLKHRIGEEMPDDDYRRGRGYTMINKFVSSAAHLEGKRIVSCEEMTNTYKVFSTSPEMLKIGSDQSILSGITHSVWHGFNYSPPDAEFPGWIQYGSYYNENNTMWPFFRFLNDYKARISALLQNAKMYTDITILPAYNDMWSEMGTQTEPFPANLNVPYTSLIWESIHKTGGGADYTSENIIQQSEVKKGKLCFGPKKYSTIFLVEVSGMFPETLEKLYEFASEGGRIFCIEKYPEKSLGFKNFKEND
ncbi:MAG: glycoside hydrolase family 2, partial [Bacteroidales bacterium]|nr:glycoside hydrolase family 2 [Bacteroidales bacterium]